VEALDQVWLIVYSFNKVLKSGMEMQTQLHVQLRDATQALDRITSQDRVEDPLRTFVEDILDNLHNGFSSEDHIRRFFFATRLTVLAHEVAMAQCCFLRFFCPSCHPAIKWNHDLNRHAVPLEQALRVEQMIGSSVSLRQQYRDQVIAIFNNSTIATTPDLIVQALQEFTLTPEGDRTDLLTDTHRLLCDDTTPNELSLIMQLIRNTPQALRPIAVQTAEELVARNALLSIVKQSFYRAFLLTVKNQNAGALFASPPLLRKQLQQSLLIIVGELQDQPEARYALLNSLLTHGFLLGVAHDHPLIENILQSLNLESMGIFRSRQQPTSSPPTPTSASIVQAPPLIPQVRRPTYANCPRIASSQLRDLLYDLEMHIRHLSKEQERTYLMEFFPDRGQISLLSLFTYLRAPLIESDDSLKKWASFARGEDHDPAPFPVWHLSHILLACTPQEGEPLASNLSVKERTLLRFVIFMNRYLYAKEEGLAAFYHELFPWRFTASLGPALGYFSFFSHQEALTRSEWLANPSGIFLQTLFSSLSVVPMDDGNHSFYLHQVIYLKNLLYKDLGLPYQPVYNQNLKNYVHKPLLQKSKHELLRSFFSFYTESYVIAAFQRQLQRDINTPLLLALEQFAQQKGWENPRTLWQQQDTNTTVTAQGARWLLQQAGLLCWCKVTNSAFSKVKPLTSQKIT